MTFERDVERREAPPIRPEDVELILEPPTIGQYIIPARNVPALLAWYFGVFAFVPLLGVPSGVVAIVLGLFGVAKARKRNVRVGMVHACFGIALGILGPAIWMLIVVASTN